MFGPASAAQWAEGERRNRMSDSAQTDQFLAIDGIHSPRIGENECGTWATVDGYQQGLAALA